MLYLKNWYLASKKPLIVKEKRQIPVLANFGEQ